MIKKALTNQQLQSVFEQAAVGMVIVDAAQSRFVKVNRRFCETVGYSAEELLRGSIHDITHPDDLRMDLGHVEQINAGSARETSWEKRYRKKDGTVVWARVFVTPLDPSETRPNLRLGVIEDITERKQAEDALQERGIQLTKLTSWVPGMIHQFTRRPDGRYCVPFATEAIQDIYGCSPQDVREDFSPIARVILPEDFDKVVGSIEHSAKHLTIWTCEYRVQIPGRSIKWISGNSTPEKLADGSITWYGFNTDITARKQVEEELRRNQDVTERLAQEIAIIAEIGKVVGSTLDIEEVYEIFAAEVQKLIHFDRIAVNLHSLHDENVRVAYIFGEAMSGRGKGELFPLKGSVSEVLTKTRAGLYSYRKKGQEIEGRFDNYAATVREGLRSLMGVPLISRGEVIGSLHFRSKTPNAYTDRDLRLAERIGTQIAGAIANAQLFSDRKRMEEEIREMSLRDQMTELYNRRGFITLAEQQIRAANRAKREMLLIFLDLDGLKGINDTLGHEEGDRALIDTADVLRQTFRESDVITRLGGDEFAVLSIDAANMNPEDLTKRLQENIDAGNAKKTRPYKLAMSWGTAVYDPGAPLSLDELMSSADARMYAQKKAKSNRRV